MREETDRYKDANSRVVDSDERHEGGKDGVDDGDGEGENDGIEEKGG